MNWTVRDISNACGVSVRTLHYYDQIGLLRPAQTTEAGYRIYGEAELNRLRQILFLRELDFPLREIHAMLDNPAFDETEAMRRQKELLIMKRSRLDRLIAELEDVLKGEKTMNLKAFDNRDLERKTKQFAKEAQQRWGTTDAWKEYEQRGGMQTFGPEAEEIFRAAADLRKSDPSGIEAQAIATQWQQYLTANYFTCTNEILAQLGELYVADERFSHYFDETYGAGTANFFSQAILSYCNNRK